MQGSVRVCLQFAMASASEKKKGSEPSKPKGPSQEEIFRKFQTLRNEQRDFALKLSEVEVELSEHKMVIDTLKDLDGGRKCFRMIDGILCERTVEDVLPALQTKRDQLINVIEVYNDKLTKKGAEINEFKELHNIRVRGQDEPSHSADGDASDKGPSLTQTKNVMVEAM